MEAGGHSLFWLYCLAWVSYRRSRKDVAKLHTRKERSSCPPQIVAQGPARSRQESGESTVSTVLSMANSARSASVDSQKVSGMYVTFLAIFSGVIDSSYISPLTYIYTPLVGIFERTLTGIKGSHVLIHNVSHSDVVLALNSLDLSLPECSVMARPKFSCFYALHFKIFQEVCACAKKGQESPIMYHPVYSDLASEVPLQACAASSQCEKHDRLLQYGAGFNLLDLDCIVKDLSMLR